MRISIRLFLSFLTASLVPLVCLVLLFYSNARQKIIATELSQLSTAADYTVAGIESALDAKVEAFKLIASRSKLRRLLSACDRESTVCDRLAIETILTDACAASDTILEIVVTDRLGQSLLGSSPTPSLLFEEDMSNKASTIELFVRRMADGGHVLLVTGPAHFNDKIIGRVSVFFSMLSIKQIVSSEYVPFGKTGEMVLVEKAADGTVRFVVSTRFEPELAANKRLPSKNWELPTMRSLSIAAHTLASADVVDYRGEKVFAVTRFIPRTNWGLVAKKDRSESLKPTVSLRNFTIFYTIVVCLIVCLFSYAISTSITGRLKKLTDFAQSLRPTGSLSDVEASDFLDKHRGLTLEEVKQEDEIGLLASSFASLAIELITINESLDTRVKERTQDLEQHQRGALNIAADARKAQIELQRSNEELDQFAYIASHDLKAPLRAIDNLSLWIEEDAGDTLPTESLQHLKKLRARVKGMENLLNDLLAYSRVGKTDAKYDQVNSREMILSTIDFIGAPASFSFVVSEEMPVLRTNRALLEMVFRNLLVNAFTHHDKDRGTIEVWSEDRSEEIEFIVKDDGPGIDPAYHEKIFQMFQSLKPREQQAGSGIGLALVKKIINNFGGTVYLESEIGKGTIFRFTLPKWN